MKLNVVVTAELDFEELDKYGSDFNFDYCGYGLDYNMLSRSELIDRCKHADILISEFDTITEEFFENTDVKLIVCCRAGRKPSSTWNRQKGTT